MRAVAMRRWLGLEARRAAMDWPMPEEQPVTGCIVLVYSCRWGRGRGSTQPDCVGWEGVGLGVDGVHCALRWLIGDEV